MIEAQVERTPRAIALMDGERHLCYREVDERANQLANHLRTKGVEGEARVLCNSQNKEGGHTSVM